MSSKYRFQFYKKLHQSMPAIYAEAKKFADDIGITPEMKGKVGLTGAVSSCHALLTREVSAAIEDASRKVIENKFLIEEIREVVKDVYGDEFDAAPTNTCEAALWTSFDALITPPITGRGDSYRARYVAPFERHLHHHGGYGRPFPPRYKDLFADRGVTAGELGFSGKRLENTDAVFVPMEGARYEIHGIKQHPAVLLANYDAKKTLSRIEAAAARHASSVTAFSSLGYDSVGYGYGPKDKSGTPLLQTGIAKLAREYGVPYIVDNAWGTPFIGADPRAIGADVMAYSIDKASGAPTVGLIIGREDVMVPIRRALGYHSDPRAIGADVMAYSMDKASGAPTVGLIIGREDVMVPIRRALGYHSDRSGAGFSYGKAAYVTNDPGKEALVGLLAALKILRDKPQVMTKPIDGLLKIVKEEFKALPKKFHSDLIISKSVNSLAVEINYENTWKNGQMGIPIFSIEDMYAGTHMFQAGMMQMGIIPTIAYDANIFISLGLGTLDADGNLLEKETRLIVKAMVGLMNIACKHAGVV